MTELHFLITATFMSGLLAFALGIFWYHPRVLGKRWMEARGKAAQQAQPQLRQIIISLMLWMLAACFYTFIVGMIDIQELPAFFSLSCLLWVAFAMPPLVMGALYTGYAFEAVSIDASYQLAGYYVFALVHIVMNMAFH